MEKNINKCPQIGTFALEIKKCFANIFLIKNGDVYSNSEANSFD